MNKNLIILAVVVIIVIGGFAYRAVFLKGEICTAEQGEDIEINMMSVQDSWQFDPADITIKKCDKVTLNIYSQDDYDHGIAIDVFGVNKRLNPMTTTTITFTAAKSGD